MEPARAALRRQRCLGKGNEHLPSSGACGPLRYARWAPPQGRRTITPLPVTADLRPVGPRPWKGGTMRRPSRRAPLAFRCALLAAAVLATLTGASAAAAPTTQRPSRQYTIDQFMATTSLNGASFSPAEDRILFSSNETGI